MTVTELVALIDARYPNAETTATKVSYMNEAQNGLSAEFGIIATDMSLRTLEHDANYSFPTGIDDIAQIETVDIDKQAFDDEKLVEDVDMQVGAYTLLTDTISPAGYLAVTHTSTGTADTLGTLLVTGSINERPLAETITPVANKTVYSTYCYDYIGGITGVGWVIDDDEETEDSIKVGVANDKYDTDRYDIGYKDDNPRSGKCVFQEYDYLGAKKLVVYPTPTISDCVITIRYRKTLTALSADSMSATPDFDSRFHYILAYYACYCIASSGASPDTTQANKFSNDYENGLNEMWKLKMLREIVSPRKRRDNKMWRK